jgi:hypothetical protein
VSIDFPTFAEQMNYELHTQTCYPSPAQNVRKEVDAFSQRCNMIIGCEYQAARYSCAPSHRAVGSVRVAG